MTLLSAAFVLIQGLLTFCSVAAQVGEICHSQKFQLTPRHNLSISNYVGEWHVHEIAGSDRGNFPTPTYDCSSRYLYWNHNQVTRAPTLTAVDVSFNVSTRALTFESSTVSINSTKSPLSSLWHMTTGKVETDVIILAADIELKEWSLVYSCSILEPDGYRYETVTGMTRSRTITPQLRQTLKSLMVGLGFHLEDQHSIRHTDCDWPDINRIEEEIKTD